MKIALLGYGRMGKTIEKIAIERGHSIVLKVDENSLDYDITCAEIAIDFSIPAAAYLNIANCLTNSIPVVSGTTGWLKDFNKAVDLCKKNNGGFIYASNYSVGVNAFFAINEFVAKVMNSIPNYNVEIEEIHHTNKLDAPSGTAISLAEGIIANSNKTGWQLIETNVPTEIPIQAKRIPDVPGTHTVTYNSNVDSISINHTAHSREGFALGAVLAAEWLLNKKGVFTMKDVLGLNF